VKFKIGDFLVYVFIVILICFSILGLKWMGESVSGRKLIVELDGRTVESINLDQNEISRELRIETGGGGYNILNITSEGVSIVEANCPDQVCVRSSKITKPGQTIICLPHKLIVKLVGDMENEENVDSTAS